MPNDPIDKSADAGKRPSTALVFALLAALVLISYGGALKAEFVYDDHNQLVQNVSIRSLENIPRFFSHPAETIGAMVFEGIYRPVRTTSFALQYRLWVTGRFQTSDCFVFRRAMPARSPRGRRLRVPSGNPG